MVPYPPAGVWYERRPVATVGTPGPWGVTVDVFDATPLPPEPTGDEYRAAVLMHRNLSGMFEVQGRYERAARHRDRMHACKDRAINACCSLCDPRTETWHTSGQDATEWLYHHRTTVHGSTT